jgi:hypothetical protein
MHHSAEQIPLLEEMRRRKTMSQAQIQTYTSCSQETFPEALQRYRHALIHLGCTDKQVLAWITTISWPLSDDDNFGDIYAAPVTIVPAGTTGLKCSGIEISLYTQPAIPSFEELPSWIGFNLLLDIEQLNTDETTPFSPAIGYTIWNILQEFAQTFTEIGAYFTNEWQENLAWRVISEAAGDPWFFDLGIFPRKLAARFETIPAGFKGTVVAAGFGFAQIKRWQELPWEVPAKT